MIMLMPEDTPRKEVVFVRVDLLHNWLKQLEKFHRDAGHPAMAEGVKSAATKIRREITKQEKPPS